MDANNETSIEVLEKRLRQYDDSLRDTREKRLKFQQMSEDSRYTVEMRQQYERWFRVAERQSNMTARTIEQLKEEISERRGR